MEKLSLQERIARQPASAQEAANTCARLSSLGKKEKGSVMKNLLCIINGEKKTVITDSRFLDAVLSVTKPIHRLTRNGIARVSVKHSSNYNSKKYRNCTSNATWFLVLDIVKDIYLLINDSALITKEHRIIAMTNHVVTHYHADIAYNYNLVLHRDTLRYLILRNGKVAYSVSYSVARKSLARVIEEIEELAAFDNALHFYGQLNAEDKRKFISTLISVDYTIKDI